MSNMQNEVEHSTVTSVHCAFKKLVSKFKVTWARVGPGHCYRIGPICFLAGWHKRRSWTRVSLVLL